MILVVDASVLIDLLVQAPAAPVIEERLFAAGTVLVAPEVLQLETMQVLRRWRARGVLSPERAEAAVEDFGALDIRYYSHGPLLERCWALKDALTTYDAAYLALAELLNAKLFTKDSAFLSVTTSAAIEVLRGT